MREYGGGCGSARIGRLIGRAAEPLRALFHPRKPTT